MVPLKIDVEYFRDNDCEHLSDNISDLKCDFLTLRLINKHIACIDSTYFSIKNGKIINPRYSVKEDFIFDVSNKYNYVDLKFDGTFSLFWIVRDLKYYIPDETAINEDVIATKSNETIILMLKRAMKKRGFVMFTHGLDNYKHIIGLKKDGTIEFLETDINNNCLPKGSDFISVVSGWLHILALRANGTICVKEFGVNDSWGLNSNAPDANNFIAIAACDGNSAALTDDGIIYVWGKGYDKMEKISAKDCIDIVMSDEMIVGLTSNGDAVGYSLLSTYTN